MTPAQAQDLLRTLRGKSLTLQDLHERVRASGSPWSVEQVELFLLCAPGVQRDQAHGTFRAGQLGSDDALQEAVVEAVRSFAGKPVPAAQIRARLPNHFVTTDEQILAIARRTAGLEVFGPKLIRITQ
ncbi:MAG: hypothetical protein JNL08_00830 [Planctomycetes bacterium]|nr:hypothetical protein [Planctomycetota bacterium]